MKISAIGLACFLAVSAGASATSALAGTAPGDIGPTPAQQDTTMGALSASPFLPPGVTLRELLRLYNGKHERHATLTYFPQNWNEFGWRQEGTQGFISSSPFENSRPLYMCQLNGVGLALFTSTDVGCEGQFLTPFGLIGYISAAPLPDTAPLYRCQYVFKRALRHFDTRMANCENAPQSSNDGILGYVFL